MYHHVIVVGVGTLLLACQTSRAGEPPVSKVGPSDPFVRVPSGKVSFERTARGFIVISNVPGNRYTFEMVGQKIEHIDQKMEGMRTLQIWVIDGVSLQSLAMPVPPQDDTGNAQQVLRDHQKYEDDHWAEGGWTEIESARKWVKFPSDEPVLYWELRPPRKAGNSPRNATKMLFANTLNGRNVIMMTVTLFPRSDEAKAKQLLVDTLLTLMRYEKDEQRAVNGSARFPELLLFNDELATRKDRKSKGAVVLKPDKLILITRMALELDADPMFMMILSDGYEPHAADLVGYDRQAKGFVYVESRRPSFLEEGNNHAGVKAKLVPGKSNRFLVSESDLKKVLQCVMIPFRCVRHYARTGGDLDEAIQEYRQLRKQSPNSDELSEARLLKAAQLLAEADEDVRSFNVYYVCSFLHNSSARALAGIAPFWAKAGRTETAVNFYTAALKRLPEDKSLDEAQRKQLAAAWESARRELTAKRDAVPPTRPPVPPPDSSAHPGAA